MTARTVSLLEREHKRILFSLILVVIVAGALYSYHLGDKLPYVDERDYCKLANNMASLHGYTYDGNHPAIFRPPGYPTTLAPIVWMGGGIFSLRMVNFVSLGLCMLIMHGILVRKASRLAGAIGPVLVLLYPVLFYCAGTLFPQMLASLTLMAVVFVLSRSYIRAREAALSGLLLGYLILLAPSFLFAWFVVTFWLTFVRKNHQLRVVAALTIGTLLVVAPWCLRNYVIYHSFVFVSANSGIMLLYGNSENTTPNNGPRTNIKRYLAQTGGSDGSISDSLVDNAKCDAFYRSQAFDFIRNNKMQAAQLYLLKVLNYFNYRNELDTKQEQSRVKDFVMLITYYPLLLALGARLAYRKIVPVTRFEVLLLLLYLSAAFSHAIAFTRIRYRLPYDFLLIMIVALFINAVVTRRLTMTLCASCQSNVF